MTYPLEELSDEMFERVVVEICRCILGQSTIGFVKGPDGGKDAYFDGTAIEIPSSKDPWKGKVVIQAKHTSKVNARFTDSDFFSEKGGSAVLNKEIPKIKKMFESNELDHYMLFSNRGLTGRAHTKIVNYICKQCSIESSSVMLVGRETIESYLNRYEDAWKCANINPFEFPLDFEYEDISEIIEAMAEELPERAKSKMIPPEERVFYDEKCKINKMPEKYSKAFREMCFSYVGMIQEFLEDPANADLLEKYGAIAGDYKMTILSKRDWYSSFSDVIEYVLRRLSEKNDLLKRKRGIVRAILFYMFWNCDIGEKHDDSAE